MSELKTDYVNDELAISMGGKRRYRMIENSDGTVSFEDATSYSVIGDEYDADDINSQNEAINQLNNDLTANSQKFKASYHNGKYGFMINNTFYEIGGGGMPTLDFANPLHTFDNPSPAQSGHGLTFTASKDCYILGELAPSASLTINGITLFTHTFTGTWTEPNTRAGVWGNTTATKPVSITKITSGDLIAVSVACQKLYVFDVK